MAKALNDYAPIQSGIMSTIHAYTGDQMILDGQMCIRDRDKAVLQSYNCIKIHTKETKVMAQNVKDSTDMIHGSIARSILLFSIPLLVGNFFQQLYNTVAVSYTHLTGSTDVRM